MGRRQAVAAALVIALFITLLISENAFSIRFDQQWNRTYDGVSSGVSGRGVAFDPSDNIISVGQTAGNIITIKYTSSGTTSWIKTFDSGADTDFSYGVAADSLGNITVVGYNLTSGEEDAILIKYEPDGTQIWNTSYHTTGNDERAIDVATDSGNNVVITGYNETNWAVLVAKFYPNGTQIWNTSYNTAQFDRGDAVITDQNDNIIAAAESGTDTLILKYYPNGTLMWVSTYGGTGYQVPEGIDIDSSGNIIVGGYVDWTGGGALEYLVAKFYPNGTQIWNTTYDSGAFEYGRDVVAGPGDSIIITGESNTSGYDLVCLTIKFDKDGNFLYQTEGNASSSNDWCNGVAIDSNDDVAVVGYYLNTTTSRTDMITYKYTPLGQPPNHSTPVLNSTYGTNKTTEDLRTWNISTTDPDSDPFRNIFDWRFFNRSIAFVNMPFDLTSSGTVIDYSSYNNDGTLGGGTSERVPSWTASGVSWGAYGFDGINDYIGVPDSDSLDVSDELTIEGWFKPSFTFNASSSHYQGLIDRGSYQVFLDKSDGKLKYIFESASPKNWSSVGAGIGGVVYALVGWNGSLYAGGAFTSAGGNSANRVAKWNGTDWSALGTGMDANVYALVVWNNTLYAGGSFTTAGGVSSPYIAKWDGTSWSRVGTGNMDSSVNCLAVWNDSLYAGGNFGSIGAVGANRVARWNGTDWFALGTGTDTTVITLGPWNGSLYVGGYFTTAGGNTVNYIAQWDGSSWHALQSGLNNYVYSLAVWNGSLYAGGIFQQAAGGGPVSNRIIRWNGTSWIAVSSGPSNVVQAIASWAGDLYVGGQFSTVGSTTVNGIAKWNGTGWSTMAAGLGYSTGPYALAVWNGTLHVGGSFLGNGDGISLNNTAHWTSGEEAEIASETSSWSSSAWHHFTLVHNQTGIKLYIDGSLESSLDLSSTISGNSKELLIGKLYGSKQGGYYTSGPEAFNGTLDEIRIYNRALSPEQVHQNYNSGVPSHDILVSQETCVCDVYQVGVTPHDSQSDGQTLDTNMLVVSPTMSYAQGAIDVVTPNGSCPSGYTPVLHLSNFSNAHAEYPNMSNYDINVCVSSVTGNITTNATTGFQFLALSSETDAHLEMPREGNYQYGAYISADPSEIYCCAYPGTYGSCPSDRTCLVTVSSGITGGFTNMHIANCTEDPYSTSICCGISVQPWSNITFPEGVYEPYNASVTWGTHKSTFNITFHEFTGASGQNLECQIRRSDNSTLRLNETLPQAYNNVTYNLNYTLTASDWDAGYVDRDQPWYVYNCSILSSEGGSVAYSNSSDYGSPLKKNIYVHGNFWTKFDTQTDDGYKAQSCYQGFDKVYFNNTKRCDWAGDVTFSFSMAQGSVVEGWCHDGNDNDGDNAVDCSDDDCNGITYSCLSHTVLPDPAFNFTNSAVCSNGMCRETVTVGGYPVTYYFNQYVRNSTTESFKVRFDAGNHNDPSNRIMEFAITSLQSGNWTGCDKYAAPGSHNLTQTSTSGITCKAWEQSSYTGDIDMVLYTNLSGYGEGQTTFELTITQYGSSLLIENIPLYINDSAPTAWNESDLMAGVVTRPCADSWDNDFDYNTNCADQDCDLQVGGLNCTNGDAYCEYGTELTCYDCFNNDAEDGYDCAEAECDLKPGDYQNLSIMCEYQEGAGYSNTTHESFYPWKTACQDMFDNDQDAAYPYAPLLNIDCCDTTVCWQKGGLNTDISNYPCPSKENNSALWCFDGLDNDYDDGSNNADCSATTGRDCRDYDCRGMTNTTHTCPTNEAVNLTGQFNASQCFDGVDNDLDNPSMTYMGPAANIDCADIDCLGVANPLNPNQVCYPYEFNFPQHYQFCADSYDNDGDAYAGWPGGTDCTDQDCYQQFNGCGPCPAEENVTWDSCADSQDDDYDNTADSFTDGQDCADINCSGEIGSTANGERCEYSTETSCFDSFDNDADTHTDCADVDCNNTGHCETGLELTCNDDRDNDADTYYDCVDTNCYGVGSCSPKLWTTTSCLTVPDWEVSNQIGSTSISTNHIYRLHVYENYTLNITGTGPYWSISLIIGKASSPAQPFLFNASNCTLYDPTDSLQWVPDNKNPDIQGKIQDINVSQSTPLSSFAVSLTCGGNSTPFSSASYPIAVSNLLSTGSEIGEESRSVTVYENLAPSVLRIEAGPVNSTDGINIPYGGRIRYRANVTNDPSGICQCQFDLDSGSFPNTDGDCTYYTTYTQDDTSYTVQARARDRANNLGSYGGSRTFQVNVMPIVTDSDLNKTEPFFYSTEDIGFGSSFQTSSDGSFPGSCNAYVEDSTGSVVWSGALTKTSLGSGAVECNGTIPAPNSDSLYKAYVNITDEDGDTVSSYKKVFYVCDSLTSSGTGWTCAKADFDQDGWTEGVSISMYGTGFVCDMCPDQVNTGRDDDADGFDNACDISCGVYNTNVTMIQDLNVTGDCFIINASNVMFDCSGFTLRGNGTGIAINITGQENVTIFNCTIENFFDGIYASGSNRSSMLMNTLYNNSDYGIWIEGTSSVSYYNNVTGNVFNENLEGALLERSLYDNVYNNTFSRNLFGIELIYANFSTVSLNIFDNNTDFWSGTIFSDSGLAVTDSDSMNNTYTNNTFRHNNVSILSGGSHDNVISQNMIYNSTIYGIYFIESGTNDNTIYNNTFLDNWVGVNITGSSSGNVLYFNNFSRSVFVHADSVSGNSFNRTNPSKPSGYTAEGNAWDDLGTLQIYDTNLDTFGDTGAQYPYSAANGANVTGYVADWGPYPANITMMTAWLNITLPEGVYEPYNATVPGTHKFDFNITFHNFTSSAGNILECEIEMSNGSMLYLNKTISGSVTNGQEYLNYNLSFGDSYNKTAPWWVHNCSLYTSGRSLLYTNDSDYGREPWLGKKIFVHGNTWTRFDNIGDDAYRALDCFLQFDKVFFNNTYRCDYSGDVAFSVAMSRGVNIEGWCHDSVDNDLNSLTDCSDQYCGGITYSCANHTPVDDPFGGTCSNGICWETKTVGGHATTYYYTRYVQNGGTLKFRFDGGSYSTSQPIAFALTDLSNGFVSYGKYAAPSSHNLTDDQIAQSGGVNVTYKTEDASGHTGDIDMVMYVNLTNGWSEGEHNITVSITQYGANLIIYDVPIIVNSSAPSNWNETDEMPGTISAPCSDPAVSGYVPDNDLDFYPNCADQDCDRFIGGTNCTAGVAYCQYGLELTCYDCFDNDADTDIDCDDSDCDLRPGDYQNLTILCEYQEGAGYSNATHESFYPWRTACSDLFDNDGDASSRYGPLLNIDCCDTTVCWQKGGTSTTDPCPRYENNTANNTVGSWCHDGIDNDYDDGSNNPDCSATTGRDCRDYDCRGVSNTTHTCPVDERMTTTGQVNNSQCFDGVDNDLDNPSMTYIGPAANIDCADIDCLGVANPLNPNQVCYPQEFNLTQGYQFCNNNYDDDGDNSFGWPNGGTDCTDPDCNKKFGSCGPCPSEENITWDSCADSIDNDHTMPTGVTDCADTDCLGEIGSTADGQVCQATETSCFDGFDNDADTYTDCADVNCNNTGYCQTGKELSCTDERDNDADGYYDCADSDCYGAGACSSQAWSTVSCITVPYTTTPSSVGGTTVSVGHLERHYVYTNYTVRIVGSGSYNSVSIILGDATDPTRYFPYDARNCTMTGTNANKLKYVSTQAQVGRIDHDPLQVGAGNPLNGFDVTLNCGGVGIPQSKTYSISITNSLNDGSPDNGAGTKSPTVYENTPPTVSAIEAGPLSSGNVANIVYGGTVRYRAIPSSDPSGICRCAFSLDGTIVQSSDGNCLYSTTYTDDDTSYQLAANATDGAANTGANGGSRTISINVKPVSTATSINMTEPFYRSMDGVLFGASFRTADSGNFVAATCNAYIEDSTGSVVWSGTLVKTGGSGSTVECNGTVPAPNTDSLYRVYVNVTDEDSDQVSSDKKVFYVCDSLTSSGTGWTCAKADFDQDGWTEGVNTTLYGDPNMVCDMCPGQVNTGLDDDADGIDNVCDTQVTALSIWDSGDPAGGGQTLRVGQAIGFYANYTYQGSELSGATCRISFGGADYAMTYSIPTKLYTYSRSFTSSGTYTWNVTCQQGGYQTRTATDSFTIIGATVGNITITLRINNTSNNVYVPGVGSRPASQFGTVWYNPPHYYFASYANNMLYGLVFAYQQPEFLRYTKTSSSHSMTIALGKQNPLAFLVFTKGDWRAIEDRIGMIESKEFLKKISPSFGYGLGLYSTVKSLLDYNTVDVQSDLVLNQGTHKIVIESNRTDSQKAVVIRRE